MFRTNDQEGVFLKMDGDLRRMLDDIRATSSSRGRMRRQTTRDSSSRS